MENSTVEYSTYILDSDDVDSNARMKMAAFCNFMQNLAGIAAEKRGFGITFMREYGFVWVLVKVRARILHYPVFNENIKLETWVRGVNRIVSDRHFSGYDNSGNKFADAITEWVLLDIKTRRPQIIEKYLDTNRYLKGKSADIDMPEKIHFTESLESVNRRKVVYSDIDLNGHVSNIKYLEWFLDTYDYDFLHNNELHEIDLNFLNECRFGELLSISKNAVSNIHYGLISRIEDKKEVFRIKLKWS